MFGSPEEGLTLHMGTWKVLGKSSGAESGGGCWHIRPGAVAETRNKGQARAELSTCWKSTSGKICEQQLGCWTVQPLEVYRGGRDDLLVRSWALFVFEGSNSQCYMNG